MRTFRSLLFTPANRFDLIAKIPKVGADAVVIDLEDGTPPNEKSLARDALPRTISSLRSAGISSTLLVRVNELTAPEFPADLAALQELPVDGVVLPKIEDPAAIERFEQAGGSALLGRDRVIGIESARGIVNADQIALAKSVTGVYFGATDLMSEIGGAISNDAIEILYARSRVVLAAKAAHVAAIDRGFGAIRDLEGYLRDCERGRALGYEGRICITPKQVEIANKVFVPSPEEIDWARKVVAAHQQAQASGLANMEYEGKSIGTAVMRRVEAILRRADG